MGCVTDRFGVPDGVFGRVPDDFYGLIGRIALIATLLEDRVLGLLWALDEEPQATHAGLSAGRLAPMIRQRSKRHAGALGDSLVLQIEAALVQVLDVLDQRHALVHSLWPEPTMETAQGWRSKRLPKSEGGGSAIVWTETSQEQMQGCLDELLRTAELVLVVTNQVWGARIRM